MAPGGSGAPWRGGQPGPGPAQGGRRRRATGAGAGAGLRLRGAAPPAPPRSAPGVAAAKGAWKRPLPVAAGYSGGRRALKDVHQEQINSCCHTQKELKHKEEFKCQLTQKNNSLSSEEGDVTKFHASPSPIVRTILNDPSTALSSDRLTGRDVHNSFGCGSLLITVTQDCKVIRSLDGRDCPTLNVVHTQAVSEDGCRKQKVYETDEFIHYLLNYYQTPSYARVCLEPKNSANKSWWKRVVSDDDSGFHISLSNKHGQHFREVSLVQNLNTRNYISDDNYRLVITVGELESTDTVLKNKAYASQLAKKLQVQRNETLSVDYLPYAGLNHSLDCTTVTHDKEFNQEDGRNEVTVPYKICRSTCKLKDLLEEISDSEYFSEACGGAMKRTERRCEEMYSNYSKGCLPTRKRERKLLVYLKNVTLEGQEKESRKCDFCSNSALEGLARQCEHRLKKSCKRSSSKLRHEGQKSERQSREEERNARKMKKKRKKLSSNLLSDECGFSEADSCIQLESLRKIQRKCNKAFHNKVKFKTLHTAVAAPDITASDGSPLQETLQSTEQQWQLTTAATRRLDSPRAVTPDSRNFRASVKHLRRPLVKVEAIQLVPVCALPQLSTSCPVKLTSIFALLKCPHPSQKAGLA
ncbi:A-kinase anchor protein 17B [Aix galericulata]|nr:A-kinase anchor protein 17B [Aix galericulata]